MGGPDECFFAEGYGGHICLVLPELDTVIVHRANTGGIDLDHVNHQMHPSIPRKLFEARV